MKENKYNDDGFFKKYSEMLRSKKGLEGAGEWSELQKVLPDFKGTRVLDLGCGYGWHCLYAAEKGAEYVLGADISYKMLQAAAEKNNHEKIEYRCCAMEDLDVPDGAFDVIISSLAFHYVENFAPLVEKISRWLKPGGWFVFSVEHPVFTSYGTQDWYYDKDGTILHFPVDRYFYEGKRDAVFLGDHVIKYHRTLTTYLNTLLVNGLDLRNVIEPQPPAGMMEIPGMSDEMRRPMMLIVAAQKRPQP